MPNTFFAMLARMKLIRRWGLMFSVREENLAEHTLDTAFFTHALIALHNARFLPAGEAPLDPGPGVQLALYHDAAQIFTGDLPTPVKYSRGEIHTAYRAVEHAAAASLLHLLPEDLRREYRRWLLPTGELARYAPYVKAADRLSALVKCMEEGRQGNAEFRRAAAGIRAALEEMALPEAALFLEEFLPAFEKNLDELKAEEDPL